MLPLVLSSDSHVFEPPDLWQTRIDAAFRDRAPRIERRLHRGRGGSDPLRDRPDLERRRAVRGPRDDLRPGALRRRAPRRVDPEQHLKDMALDGVAGEVLYPSQGLFYFKVADTALMSAIFRAYNDWLAEFCRTDPARLKGIAMINLDDVQDGLRELERAARLGLAGAMITEYPAEDRRYDQPEYEPFWAAAAALDLPLSLHTRRRDGRARSAGPATRRCATRAAAQQRRSIRRCRCGI